jgi:hypothetical protein
VGYIDFAPMSPEKSRGVIRNAPQTSKLLVQVLRKIPIFKGLSPSQVAEEQIVTQPESKGVG